MKVYRDIATINNKERLGRHLSLTGIAILFVGMFASFVPNFYPPEQPAPHALGQLMQAYWPMVSLIALPVGFACASFGSYFVQRFARRHWPNSKYIARPDEALERSLKGFDDKYSLYIYSLPANYVLVGPCGVLSLIPRSENGTIRLRGENFSEPLSFTRILTIFAREGVRSLKHELREQRHKMEELLTDAEPSDGTGEVIQAFNDVPVESAAVFLNGNVNLELENPTVNALRAGQLKEFVRSRAKTVKLQTSKIRALTDYLDEASE